MMLDSAMIPKSVIGRIASFLFLVCVVCMPLQAKDKRNIEAVNADIERLQKTLVQIRGQQSQEQKALEDSDKQIALLLKNIRSGKQMLDTEQKKLEELAAEKKFW
ncbi:MAG: hypothetical protein KDI30_01795 [Pseudomonadales bacterium]|nr:hypothetical protein [Pseudomonadales bacterium]